MVKKLRSKDGYVLAYVVVVITILMAVAAGTALAATRNLSAQTEAVKQLEARYAAEGKLEELVGEIWKEDGMKSTSESDALEAYRTHVILNAKTSDEKGKVENDPQVNDNSITATLTASDEGATITAEVKINCDVTLDSGTTEYTVTPKSITYLSYDITYTD